MITKKKRANPEADLQRACVKYFNLQYPQYSNLLIKIHNEGARSVIMGRLLKLEGLNPGAADIMIAFPCGCLFIEFKSRKGVQSDSQKEFEKAIKKAGYSYYLCNSIELFIDLIKIHLYYGNNIPRSN